jgi:hypothetical protein
MRDLTTTENTPHESIDEEGLATLVEIGDVAVLTQGQGGGNSEDKRRAYNC